jgi:nicotinate-nucleotide pyrophosphorylase (carboxylating)
VETEVVELIRMALAEDLGCGDVTGEYFVPEGRRARGFIKAREEGVLSGVEVAARVFLEIDSELDVHVMVEDGRRVGADALVLEVSGSARSILSGERTALNFLQRLSGVATLTRQFVDRVAGMPARILDTRKTTPGWRPLEKQAVVHGGGGNHRMGLYDRAMVKDNHLVVEGGSESLQEAISRLKAERPEVEVELEADRLEQVERFLALDGVDQILLDNMGLEEMRRAVEMRGSGGPVLEASGGVTLKTVRAIAETGVDCISVGVITHSARALDLGLDFVPYEPGS